MAIYAAGRKCTYHKSPAILQQKLAKLICQNSSWAPPGQTHVLSLQVGANLTRQRPSWEVLRPFLHSTKTGIRRNSSSALPLQKTHLPQTHLGLQEASHDQILILCKQGDLDRALHVLFILPSSANPPPDQVYLSLLNICKKEKCLSQALRLYTHIITHSSQKLSIVLGNQLVHVFVACGGIEIATKIFLGLTNPTSSSWEALISGYAGSGQGIKALEMYFRTRQSDMEPHVSTITSLLKICGSIQDLEGGRKLHSDAVERRDDADVFVGSTLVSMYGKCRRLSEAEKVFGALVQRNVVSWNSMLASYIENENEEAALRLFRQMQEEGVTPNHLTFMAALRACGTLGDKKDFEAFSCGSHLKLVLDIGRALHADARKRSVASNAYVESALLSMYKKCGSFLELEDVFSSLLERNVVSWNVMLAALMDQGLEETTLQLYRAMQEEGVKPDHQTTMVALLACCNLLEKEHAITIDMQSNKGMSYKVCEALYHDSWQSGFAFDIILGSMFINVYGKCGAIEDAEDVFGKLSSPDVATWNAMLSVYAEQLQAEKAFKLYRQMHEEMVCQDGLTLVAMLQACGSFAGKEEAADYENCNKVIASEIGNGLHSVAQKQGLESSTQVANTLISMYGKFGRVGHSEVVFDRLVKRDVVSWNAMLSAYIEQEQFDLVLQLYCQMRKEGFIPDRLTIAVAILACGIAAQKEETSLLGGHSLKEVSHEIVRALHFEAVSRGFDLNKHLRSSLVSTYSKCGAVFEAEKVFLEACQPDTFYWNAMLVAYVEHDRGDKALQLYKVMQDNNFVDKHTVVIALKACATCIRRDEAVEHGHITAAVCLEIGHSLHAYAWKNGLGSNMFVGSTLISMYGKCGCIEKAKHVFDRMARRDTVLWNAMLFACVEHGEGEDALQLFCLMQKERVSFDHQTLTMALQACCILAEREKAIVRDGQAMKVSSLRIGQSLHSDAVQSKEVFSDVVVLNSLVSMYGKCGAIREAEKTFDCLWKRSISSWNAMLSAYLEYDQCEKAIQLYHKLQKMPTNVDDVTCGYILQACSQTGRLDVCRQVHFIAASSGVDLSFLLSTTLAHTYGNCGCMLDAKAVFQGLPKPDVVAWSTCVSGFAQQGKPESSFLFFDKMHMEGIIADEVTCSSFLFACSHAGLVDEGVQYFNSMDKVFGITSTLKHYANVIDLLARTGNLAKVEYVLEKMPIKPDLAIWMCVLSACCLHGNLELAKFAFTSAIQLQPVDSAGYILMSNVYQQRDPMECVR
ncbi:hypothetical protein GOP47_0005745 [Adiantum capillus-veneris]|uniref:Pentatricopeptide repeat-containing protein n=1 Tax=Adiantum capillus-veneris TaxID=13818 RepID=A0A9D4V5M6_ADICA|nr:hypothetical protein GOP47_0005745 [Adiantum capillus-veneris]